MLIRQRLILNFSILVITILIALSIVIYVFYAIGKENSFRSRLKNKAISSAFIFSETNQLDEIALKSLTRQYEVIYDDKHNELYSIGNSSNFIPSPELLQSIRQNREIYFDFKEHIEGIGIYYTGKKRNILVIVTGIDSFGIDSIELLKEILIWGNIIGFLFTLFAALFFSNQALKPINNLITQIRFLTGNHLNERLPEGNTKDEIVNLSIEFNKLFGRLETTVESTKSFVSNTSHELRTPLTTILGTLETSYVYDNDLESTKRSIQSSIEELKKIIELTNGLLNMVQVENRERNMAYENIDFLEVVLDCINSNRKKFLSQNIELIIDKIVDESSGYFIAGNKHLITIAISNIIDNACKYSAGSNVIVSLRNENMIIQLFIKDEGYGISKEDQEKMFTPLYRGSNIKNIGGFGIGLALVSRIIQLHNGNISIVSELSKGTEVKVVLKKY